MCFNLLRHHRFKICENWTSSVIGAGFGPTLAPKYCRDIASIFSKAAVPGLCVKTWVLSRTSLGQLGLLVDAACSGWLQTVTPYVPRPALQIGPGIDALCLARDRGGRVDDENP